MNRRFFLATGLALVGFGRRVWAQVAGPPVRYAALTRPVSIPLQDVTAPWQPVAFVPSDGSRDNNRPAKARAHQRRLFRTATNLTRLRDLSARAVSADLITDRHGSAHDRWDGHASAVRVWLPLERV
jgi:hypothetical protein